MQIVFNATAFLSADGYFFTLERGFAPMSATLTGRWTSGGFIYAI